MATFSASNPSSGTVVCTLSGLDTSYIHNDRTFSVTCGGSSKSTSVSAGASSASVTFTGTSTFTTLSISWSIDSSNYGNYGSGSTSITTGGNITISAGTGGSVSSTVGTGTVFVAYGQSVTFTATASSGYSFSYWSLAGTYKYSAYVTYSITTSGTYKAFFSSESSGTTYYLKYDANGGTGAPSQQSATSTASSYTFTISSTVPTYSEKTFAGWATSSSVVAADYQPGGSITVTQTTTTLYAVWSDSGGDTGGGSPGWWMGVPNFERADLPDGYTQTEYIEGSGTQYFDTGFIPDSTTRVVLDGQYLGGCESETWLFIMSAMDTSSTKRYSVMYNYSTKLVETNMVNDTAVTFSTAVDGMSRLHIDKNKNVCTINGETRTNVATAFESTCSLCLYARRIATGVSRILKHRIWACAIWDNGTLVRNFIPCKDSSGIAGMYDLANAVFYTASGSGDYIAGPEYSGDVARKVADIYIGINGVARKVVKAYMGVNGIARLCYTSTAPVTVTITGTGSTATAASYVVIDGTTYSGAATLSLPVGTVISCYAGCSGPWAMSDCWIKVDGTTVATAAGGTNTQISYEHTLTAACTITLAVNSRYGNVTITTT